MTGIQCLLCAHYDEDAGTCPAFPEMIPAEVHAGVRVHDKVFERFIAAKLSNDVVVHVSAAVNQGRREIEDLDLEDSIVSVTRVSVMDPKTTCAVCKYYDDMTMDLRDAELGNFIPPAGCLGGDNCWCIALYNQESMRPLLREVDYAAPPSSMQEEMWQ